MKTLIMKRVEGIRDRFLMRTSRIGTATQVWYGQFFAEKLFEEAARKDNLTGHYLYICLPSKMSHEVINRSFDPYNKSLTKAEIFKWLWNHVIFDPDGNVVAIHDRGYLLVNEFEWHDEVKWFSRVKRSEWKRSVVNGRI